jgi:hypothetical protein
MVSDGSGLLSRRQIFFFFSPLTKNLPSSMTRRPWPVDGLSTTLDRLRSMVVDKSPLP